MLSIWCMTFAALQVMKPNWRSFLNVCLQAVTQQATIALCAVAVIPGCHVLLNNVPDRTDQRFWLKLTGATIL